MASRGQLCKLSVRASALSARLEPPTRRARRDRLCAPPDISETENDAARAQVLPADQVRDAPMSETENDAARAEVIRADQVRDAPMMPGGAQAATAAAMQNQHVADDVNAAARRLYLGVPEDVLAKVTPFEQYQVVEMLTQVVAGTNYFFKIQIADSEFIQLRVFCSLFGDLPKIVAMRRGAEAAAPLTYFDASPEVNLDETD